MIGGLHRALYESEAAEVTAVQRGGSAMLTASAVPRGGSVPMLLGGVVRGTTANSLVATAAREASRRFRICLVVAPGSRISR
jgi:hypothetical protein